MVLLHTVVAICGDCEATVAYTCKNIPIRCGRDVSLSAFIAGR